MDIDPEYWDAYILLGSLCDDVGKIDEAIKLLEEGMERIINKGEEGRFFYKNEEKAKEMHSLLKKLKEKKTQEEEDH